MSELPPYIQFPGSVVFEAPCTLTNANMYGFFIKGDLDTMQQFVDDTINVVKADGLTFKALTAYCLLTFTDIEKIRPTKEPFASYGYFQEADVLVWVPVARMVDGKIDHVYLYPAFICINGGYAQLNGRETWGFNKSLCTYQMPKKPGDPPDYFSMTVDSYKTFSPDTQLLPNELFNVKMIQGGSESPFRTLWELIETVWDFLQSAHLAFDFDLKALAQFLGELTNPAMDLLLFKQLPNGDATQAIYQAIVHAPIPINAFHSGCIYTHEYEFTLYDNAMFPLQNMFGISSQKPTLPFNVYFDFTLEAASEIASNVRRA